MTANVSAVDNLIGQRVHLAGHFQEPVTIEGTRSLGTSKGHGFDIRSLGPADPATGHRPVRRIEVKGRARGQPVRLTVNECLKARQLGESRRINRSRARAGSLEKDEKRER